MLMLDRDDYIVEITKPSNCRQWETEKDVSFIRFLSQEHFALGRACQLTFSFRQTHGCILVPCYKTLFRLAGVVSNGKI